mgnify:CR=1 FL=1
MSDKLREAALAVLKSTKNLHVCCGDFSHSKTDLHRDDNCPPWRRYNDALATLEAALAEPEEKLLSIHRLDQWLKASLAEQKPMLEMNPQKREWVGLTNEEIDKWNIVGHESLREFVRSLEAKIKDKNCG